MRILVTGSQGTLGKPLVRELRRRGHDVTGCDLMHAVGDIRTDIRDAWHVDRTFDEVKPHVVMHLAGEFGRRNGLDYPEELWPTNCLGTSNIISACIRHDAHLVFASSSEAYGNIAELSPLKEELLATCVPGFLNEYSLSKWTNERQIEIGILNYGLTATILRFFNIYGPGERYTAYRSVVCQFIYRALHNLPITCYAETTRSFLYVDDWCNAVTNVLHRLPCDTFNIASTEQVSMKTLLDMVVNAVGGTKSQITMVDHEQQNVRDKVADSNKARDQLGLMELVPLQEGIKRTVAWMRRQDAEL